MRLLWVATKPPWPPVDGGRRVLAETVACLRSAGHEVRVVAPGRGAAAGDEGLSVVRAGPRPWPAAVARALWRGWPVTVARHELPAVRAAVAAALSAGRWDAVVAEQLQALPQCEPARAAGLPVVLRAQNVESDLWAGAARFAGAAGPVLGLEGRRLARHEAAAVARVSAVAALTPEDAARLRELAPAAEARELQRLRALLQRDGSLAELNALLCERIADGRIDLQTPGLPAHLWQSTLDKLAVDQPSYASYRRAKEA